MKQRKNRGRPGVTLEEVRAACERLDQQRRSTGPKNTRIELGRGSYTTILNHLRALGRAPPASPRKRKAK